MLDGRVGDDVGQRVREILKIMMAVAPESLSWCSSSRAVYSGLTLTQV